MSRRLLVLAVVLAAGWIAVRGQTLPGAPTRAPVTQPNAPRTNPRGIVAGQIVDSASGRGVPRAAVHITGSGLDQLHISDDRGRFYFLDVPEGDVEVTASKAGFFDGAFGKRRAGGRGIPLTMTAGRWLTDLKIELFKGASISGQVSDDSGEPLIGIRVRAWRRDAAEGREQLVASGEVMTDDAGGYRLFGLKPGAYIISVPSVQVTLPVRSLLTAVAPSPELWALLNLNQATSADDHLIDPDGKYMLAVGQSATPPTQNDRDGRMAYRTEFYPGFETPEFAIPIQIAPAEDRVGVHFQLRLVPAHRIDGRVTGPDGPLSNQLVRLVIDGADDNGFGSEAATTMSGPDGEFALLNVPAGHYSLQVRTLAGIMSAASPALPTNSNPLAPVAKTCGELPLQVGDGDVRDVKLNVERCPTLSGHIMLEGRPRASAVNVSTLRISVLPEGRTIGSALTRPLDADGRFVFDGLAPGAYFIRVGNIPPGFALKSISGAAGDLIDRPIALNADADLAIVLSDQVTELWGTVRDPRGAQAAGATVLMFPATNAGGALSPNRAREVRAATSGLYSIAGLPAGDYCVVAIDDLQAERWQDARTLDALRSLATRVTVREGERKLLDIQLQPFTRK